MAKSGISASRRDVLKGTGGGLMVLFSLGGSAGSVSAQEESSSRPGSLEGNPELDSWITIGADETVTVTTGKVELGQGIQTAVGQIAADELDVAFDRVTIETADTTGSPDEGYTAGSGSMEQSGTAITYAAAEARSILLDLAAEELGADRSELSVDDGTVSTSSGESTTYWELLGGESFERTVEGTAEPKSPDEQTIVGTDVGRRDIPNKVSGQEAYVHDLEREGMVHGRVVRPPSYGATLSAVETGEVEEMDGVIEVVRDGSFLGVVAEREWQAIEAMNALSDAAEWDVPGDFPADHEEVYSTLLEEGGDGDVIDEYNGRSLDDPADAETAADNAAVSLDAEYRIPYRLHGSIGPSCAVAEEQDGELVVWSPTQGVYPLRTALAGAEGDGLLDRTQDEVRCVHSEGAGCYGHNGADDVAGDAALLSEAVGGDPVRLQWMRDQEHQWEPLGTPMVVQLSGGVDDGDLVGLHHEVWSYTHATRPPLWPVLADWQVEDGTERGPTLDIGGYRDAGRTYEIPDHGVTNHFLQGSPFRVSALRGLGSYSNVFASESFIDELAVEAGVDPLEFRLGMSPDDRSTAVLEEVADLSGWRDAEFGENAGHGIAFNRYENNSAYAAVVAEVTVDTETGEISIDAMYGSDDSGEAVSPDGIENQIEGGMIQAASWTLKESVDFGPDGIEDQNWNDYPILNFTEVPEVDVSVIDNPGEPYLGTGEAATGPTPAAIGNAVYDAVGARIRELPMTPERVLEHL